MNKKIKKGRFADKGKSILKSEKPDEKPNGIGSFLDDEDDKKENKNVRKAVKTEKRKDVFTESRTKEKKPKKTEREEFRLPFELSERLRNYAHENRTTKTAVVIEALEKLLDE